jgi:hypothetical protein
LLSLARRGNNIAPRVVSPCESCGTPDAQLNSGGDPMKLFTTFCCAALALCSAVYAQSPADHITVHFNTPVIVGTDADGSPSVVLNRRGNDLHVYKILLNDSTGYQLNNAE